MEETVTKTAYIEGRLKGLNELVGILKEAMNSPETTTQSAILKTIVSHLSKETESIIGDLESHHGEHPILDQASEKQQEIASAASSPKEITIPMMKKQVDTADELMKSLSAFKKQKEDSYLFDAGSEDSEK
jgi:hypothetical protein